MAKSKPGISYMELARYEEAVANVLKTAQAIQKETRYYESEAGMAVSDGKIYTGNIRTYIATMQANLRVIDGLSKKYGGY